MYLLIVFVVALCGSSRAVHFARDLRCDDEIVGATFIADDSYIDMVNCGSVVGFECLDLFPCGENSTFIIRSHTPSRGKRAIPIKDTDSKIDGAWISFDEVKEYLTDKDAVDVLQVQLSKLFARLGVAWSRYVKILIVLVVAYWMFGRKGLVLVLVWILVDPVSAGDCPQKPLTFRDGNIDYMVVPYDAKCRGTYHKDVTSKVSASTLDDIKKCEAAYTLKYLSRAYCDAGAKKGLACYGQGDCGVSGFEGDGLEYMLRHVGITLNGVRERNKRFSDNLKKVSEQAKWFVENYYLLIALAVVVVGFPYFGLPIVLIVGLAAYATYKMYDG